MQPIVSWFTFDSEPNPQITVRGVGIMEEMKPCFVHRPDGTDDYLFMFFYDKVCLGVQDGKQWYAPGTLIIWRPGDWQYYGNDQIHWRHSWIHCRGYEIDRLIKLSDLPLAQPIDLPHPEDFEQMLRETHQELTSYAQPDWIIVENLLHNWFRQVFRVIHGPAESVPPRMLAVKQCLEQNFSKPLRLEELANLAHISVPHLCSEFKIHFRTSPIKYLINIRLNHALYLLQDRNLRISDIARRVGYDDIYHFSRLFKTHLGRSPQHMRKA